MKKSGLKIPSEILLFKNDSTLQDVPEFVSVDNIKEEIADQEEVFIFKEEPVHNMHLLDRIEAAMICEIAGDGKTQCLRFHPRPRPRQNKCQDLEFLLNGSKIRSEPMIQINKVEFLGESGIIKSEEVNVQNEDKQDSMSSISYVSQEGHSSITGTNQSTLHKNFEGGDMFTRSQCDQTACGDSLTNHLIQDETASELRRFKCLHCDYRTTDRNNLKNHLLRHKKAGECSVFKCTECDFQTAHKTSLPRHIIRHKNPKEVEMKCGECGYKTIHKNNFKQHVLRHFNSKEVDKTLECNECGYRAVFQSVLERHLLMHGKPEERSVFKCADCDFQSVHKRSLNRHVVRHKNRKEIEMKCNECSYKTIYKNSLKQHLLRHSKEVDNVFKCDKCDYRAVFQSTLNRHLAQHNNTEEGYIFKCNECDFRTVHKRSLNRHADQHNKLK